MYPLDTRGLFTKDSFLSELRKEQVRNDKTLQEINNQVTTRENYGLFGVSFLTYLIHDLPPNEILVKLACMVQHMDYLADHLEARRMIFSFCLKIRSNQMHLFDAQINHLVYTLLQACSFSSEVWQKELDGSSSDKLLSYPQKIVFDEHLSDVACIRFALFNVLYGTDMQPLQYNHDDTFKFSDAWVQLLKESKRSNAFLIETQVIENALRNPEKNLACYAMDLDSLTLSLSSDVFDTVIREACQSLIHTHPKFIPYITRALIHLLQVGRCINSTLGCVKQLG
ncbi:uncharacterized protein EV154DRAFT_481256 [Mucor mucedo]|uniref:uncharacterized protein n=1 Tax=Mucor mucedo TaxID=29922 RepID=UPI00221E63AA|nr:uncharacterized protein EV154DRAFT_481256 [Mucor mucedo]KAI7891379.1 hypothetical protein EV154DRAFT_481256 [Mucor mucedo]